MPITSFAELLSAVEAEPVRKIAVAAAADAGSIEAFRMAGKERIAEPIFVGDAAKIRQIAEKLEMPLRDDWVVDAPDEIAAARMAVKLVSEGRADALMKGMIHTDDFLRALLDKEIGLRTGAIMSHCFLMEIAEQKRLILATDAAMNIAPTLVQKADIALNAVYLARLLGIEKPKLAAVCAVEVVNPNMPATVDAAVLAKMCQRGQFPDCVIDGPLAMDNAISELAAKQKKIDSEVAGKADILLVPDIEAGNILVKTFSHLCGGRTAGVLIGAAAPVVLTSRADSADAKKLSIATAVLMSHMARSGRLKIGKLHY